MLIRITDDDFRRRLPCSSSDCPAALALRRVTGRRFDVSTVCIERHPDGATVPTPKYLAEFIRKLDATDYEEAKSRKPPRPVAFEVPDDFLFLGP